MSTIIAMERDPHAAVLSLLPWYARGQLSDDEMQEVHDHLQACPPCQAELAAEQYLQALLHLPLAAGDDVDAGLARMRARIDAAEQAVRPAGQASLRPGLTSLPRWLGWALGMQGAAIATLLLLLVWPRPELTASYRGLSSAGPAGTVRALIMFKPEARERDIREALQAGGASLVGGPTESGAYQLQLPLQDRQQALQGLRARPVVILVESLEAEPAR